MVKVSPALSAVPRSVMPCYPFQTILACLSSWRSPALMLASIFWSPRPHFVQMGPSPSPLWF